MILARFRGGKHHLESFVWPCPKAIPWHEAPALDQPFDFASPVDPTSQYAALWHTKEQSAAVSVASWVPAMRGRGQQVEPKRKVGAPAPIKQGRNTDIQPGFFGFSAVHAKQFRQLRRLQNYCRWVDAFERTGSGDGLHGIGLWRSILRAPGFVPTFSRWWLCRQYVSPVGSCGTYPLLRRLLLWLIKSLRLCWLRSGPLKETLQGCASSTQIVPA